MELTSLSSDLRVSSNPSVEVRPIYTNTARANRFPLTTNLSAGLATGVNTETSLVPLQQIWEVSTQQFKTASFNIELPLSAFSNTTQKGHYVMLISKSINFDQAPKLKVLTPTNSDQLETSVTFDAHQYVTFAFSPDTDEPRCIYFDGDDDYIDISNTLNLNPEEFSISAWILRSQEDSGVKSILSKQENPASLGYDFRILGNNRIELFWNNGTNQSLISNAPVPSGEWHHVAGIYDGNQLSLYIDGVLSNSEIKSPPTPTDYNFKIAALGELNTSQHFKGHIDEVRLWKTALTKEQLRFMMNQEIENQDNFVTGKVLPHNLEKNDLSNLSWSDLEAYYPMSSFNYTVTEDASSNDHYGNLVNLNTVDLQTAPLPYQTQNDGSWNEGPTWKDHEFQTLPNATSVVDAAISIDWNIVTSDHNLQIETDQELGRDRHVMALLLNSESLIIEGNTLENTGNGLSISHYLKLDGTIDLEGKSQLILNEGCELDALSSGWLEKDQQGNADVYTYDYWSSPVGQINATQNNKSFAVKHVMFDDQTSVNFLNSGYNGAPGSPISIADYWIWKFANNADYDYTAWQHLRKNGTIRAGEGFTMKGPGTGSPSEQQNYVFKGKPNNGTIHLTLNEDNDYLVGNPYPSAMDADQFIRDNGPKVSNNQQPLISGTLYFWEHWGGNSHSVSDYQGGYATYNLSGGVGAASFGTLSSTISAAGTVIKTPSKYITTNKGFFVVGERTGEIEFNNTQRVYQKEGSESPDTTRPQLRLGFNSVNTIHRQLLLTIDENATVAYDWAYDAALYYQQMDDLYWMIDSEKYNIQGSDDLEAQSTYALGIKTKTSGTNTITIDMLDNIPEDLEIYIHDLVNDTYHDLRANDFEFFLNSGEYNDRFELTFQTSADNVLSTNESDKETLDVIYSNSSKKLIIKNPNSQIVENISIYNTIGQQIMTYSDILNVKYCAIRLPELSSGTYIIQIKTPSETLIKKIGI